MRRRSAAARRRSARATALPQERRHWTWGIALFSLGLLGAAVLIAWAATRHGASAPPTRLAAADGVTMTVHKSPTCGCCGKWVKHMEAVGFDVTVVDRPDVAAVRAAHGVPDALASCHTTTLRANGAEYVLEGHVTVADVARLLRERPQVRGIAVPGMPPGSPGMEGGIAVPYDVVAFDASGATRVFASH